VFVLKALIVSNITKRIQAGHYSMISPLHELGYEVHWVANLSNYKGKYKLDEVTLNHIGFERNPFSVKNIKAAKELYQLMKVGRYEVVHCNSPVGGLLGRVCARFAGVKTVIYTAHGFHFYKGAPLVNRTVYKFAEIILAKITDGIITMNKEDYENGKKLSLRKKGKCYYTPGIGIDVSLYANVEVNETDFKSELGFTSEDFLIISMGDLIARKNYVTALKAISLIKKDNLHYIICGDGILEDSLKEEVVKLGLENNVHFLGFRRDIAKLLRISDLYLLTTYQEGLPRALMEAMSVGLPAVVSAVRGNIDLVENEVNGYTVEPNDAKGFATAIEKLFIDSNARTIIGGNNLEKVRAFDINSVKEHMRKIYKEISIEKNN
jgi:glycosyltransferase involved in cell wall biosynthesis